MTKYKSNFVVTIVLIIFTSLLYIFKNIGLIAEEIKLFAYLLLVSLNMIILFKTLSNTRPLNSLLSHKLSGENAKAKVGFLIKNIKDITKFELKVRHGLLSVFSSIILTIIVILLEGFGVDVYRVMDIILDLMAVLSLSNVYLQLHISYSIYKYLVEIK